jgi:hypothetical protein
MPKRGRTAQPDGGRYNLEHVVLPTKRVNAHSANSRSGGSLTIDDFTSATRQLIAAFYAEDFRLFNYSTTY